VEDETGAFDWVNPDQVHGFVTCTDLAEGREDHDIIIGGAELAGLALEADLVDECHLFLNPVIVGGGKPAFRGALRRNLELLETRRFGTGVIHLRYCIYSLLRGAEFRQTEMR
jgi:dihydrofolate reductase